MNSWNGIGRLTKDIELKFTPSNGKAIAKFTVAVNRDYKNANGEYEADFINCLAFDKRAEVLSQYVKKGQLIGIRGRIQTGSYDTQDGTKRYTTEILVEGFDFLGGNQGTNNNNNNANNNINNSSSNSSWEDATPVDDGDMPF